MRWDTLHELLQTAERPTRLTSSAGWMPAADLVETRESYTLVVELPGLHLDEVDLSATSQTVTLRGERRAPAGNASSYVRVERGYGRFMRRFEVAEPIDVSRVTATLSDGILTVVLPKAHPPPSGPVEIA